MRKIHRDDKRTAERNLVMTDGNKIIALSAYLAREACGLEDEDTVTLDVGAERVRIMALGAVKERDKMTKFIRFAIDIVSEFGDCSRLDEGEDFCAHSVCPYCELTRLVENYKQ